VGRALLEYYPGEREAYLDDYDLEESEKVPEVTELAGLRPLVGLSRVHVLSAARGGGAWVGVEVGWAWGTEEGAWGLKHLGRVIATGQADCSFVGWIARRGLDRQ